MKLHIVARAGRRDKVFQEIYRRVFLADYCTLISYNSLMEPARLKHLEYVSDSVLEEYEEVAE